MLPVLSRVLYTKTRSRRPPILSQCEPCQKTRSHPRQRKNLWCSRITPGGTRSTTASGRTVSSSPLHSMQRDGRRARSKLPATRRSWSSRGRCGTTRSDTSSSLTGLRSRNPCRWSGARAPPRSPSEPKSRRRYRFPRERSSIVPVRAQPLRQPPSMASQRNLIPSPRSRSPPPHARRRPPRAAPRPRTAPPPPLREQAGRSSCRFRPRRSPRGRGL